MSKAIITIEDRPEGQVHITCEINGKAWDQSIQLAFDMCKTFAPGHFTIDVWPGEPEEQ